MHHRQPVRIHRTPGLLRDEVVHDAEKARGQKKPDRVMSVPPLHHCILHTGVDRVRFPECHRDRRAVDEMQQCDGQDERAEEPVRDVNVPDAAFGERAEKNHRIRNPHQSDQDIDRPFELRVLLAAGEAKRQSNRGQHDNRLPAPERESRQRSAEQARMTGALHDVIRSREQRAAAERKNHRVGVQRAQPAIREPRPDVELGPRQLRGDDHADQHANHAPHHGHERELPHDPVVVCVLLTHQSHSPDLCARMVKRRAGGAFDLYQPAATQPSASLCMPFEFPRQPIDDAQLEP